MAAYTTINNPELYYQNKVYSGNGTAIGSGGLAVTFDGEEDMQPDFVWLKRRQDSGYHHNSYDSVRGATKIAYVNLAGDMGTKTEGLTAFNSNGFTLGNDGDSNASGKAHVAWCWKETATAGFDIVSFTGNSTARTISHSLSAVPNMIIVKNIDEAENWCVYHTSIANTKALILNTNTAELTDSKFWNDTSATSSVFTVGNGTEVNGSSDEMIAYCFAEKQGFSKFGSYVGNGSADGPFIFLGFRPAWVLTKRTDSTGNWNLFDNRRTGSTANLTLGKANPMELLLHPDLDNAEVNVSSGGHTIDGLATGFKIRSSSAISNASGGTYIYACFAETPLVNSNGVPCNAM